MKHILLCLLIFLVSKSICAQWRTCYQGNDVNNRITGVSFFTASTGYIASENWVGYTTDSGKTVIKKYVTNTNVNFNGYSVNLTFGFTIEGVYAFSADTLVAYGDYAFEPSILYSTNGGTNWKVVYHKDIRSGSASLQNGIYDLTFPMKGNIGFAVQNDEIIKTTNRGATWTTTNVLFDKGFFRLSFSDATRGFAIGPFALYKTIDAGVTWSQVSAPGNITGISAVSSTNNVFLNADGDTYYSSNNGNSFSKINTPSGKLNTNDIHFINDSTGYATVQAYSLFQTRNRGKSWELMPGSNTYSYLGYGYSRLYFFNNNLAWACGENEYLSFTANGGGTSLPKATFDYDISNTCTTGNVILNNTSHGGYIYKWLRNKVQFASGYNATYAVTSSTDTISLIIIKGSLSDTATQIITASSLTGFSVNSAPQNDTICSNSNAYFDIYNSIPGADYQVGRICCGFGPVVQGNGSTITVNISTNSGDNGLYTFTVKASKNGTCGLQTAQQNFDIRILNTYPDVIAISDTVCTQKPFNIIVSNSIPGYLYWTDTLFPKVSGTGGNIQLPTRAEVASYTFPVDFDNIITRYQFGVFVKHTFGCGSAFPSIGVNMVGRNTKAQFITNSHESFTGSPISFIDKSIQANTYNWTFPNTNLNNSTAPLPTGLVYNQSGIQRIQQKTITKEGCVDSAFRYIEVYSGTTVNNSATCSADPDYPGTDSIRKQNYFVSRTLYEDEKGDHVVAGGYTDMRFTSSFYPRGYDGAFACKYSKSGTLLWYFQTTTGDDYFTFNANSHIIFEQAIGDKSGNTYLLGHSLNRNNISDTVNTFTLQRANGFLLKLNAFGKIVWVKTLYNKDNTGSNISLDYAGGSLLRGKNDDIYLVTHRYTPSIFYDFMSGTDIVSAFPDDKTGLIIHYDANGNVLRKKNFPIQYNNLRRFNTFTNDSYDRMPSATWDSTGKLVVYGNLNAAEMNGSSIDGFTIPFNINNIQSALLFFDTTSLAVVNVKPLFNATAQGNMGIHAESYAIDAAGNYYAGYSGKIAFPTSNMTYQSDSVKVKSYIIAYNANGTLRWKKQMEGLQPLAMLAYTNDIKVYGTNYIMSGFTNQNMVSWVNTSPALQGIKKLTIVTDSASYNGKGKTGIGNIDNVVASINTADGSLLSMLSLGTTKEEETGTMRRGYADQFWATGTIGLDIRGINITDTASTLMIYKLPVGTNCNTLPIILNFFKVSCTNGNILCNWQTLSEINADKFFIQQSKDGSVWKTITTIKAAGNSSLVNNYEWRGSNNLNDNYLYRLAETDKDGYTTYSGIVKTHCAQSFNNTIKLYPNPTNGYVAVNIMSKNKTFANYIVTTSTGQIVRSNGIIVEKGLNSIDINISALPKGIYKFSLLINNEKPISEKLIKL